MITALAIVTLVATLAALPRLICGPTPGDRIIALQLGATGTLSTLIVLSVAEDATAFLDIALVFAVLAALGSVAFVSLMRGAS